MNEPEPRQRIVRVGSRRAKLTPAPGTTAEPHEGSDDATPTGATPESGPNDARLRADVPPHY